MYLPFTAERTRERIELELDLCKKLRQARIPQNVVDQIESGLFTKQLDYVRDESPFQACWTSRRAGKTTANSRKLLLKAEKIANKIGTDAEDPPKIGYLAPTLNQAKRLMWGRLQMLNKHRNLGYRFDGADLIAYHPKGAEIWILGANTERDIDRIRGFPFAGMVVDEAQALGNHGMELIEDVIEPALADYGGWLALSGTPNASCRGIFHDVCHSDSYSHHHWLITDNRMLPRWREVVEWRKVAHEFLADILKKKGWNEDNPTYQREWLAKWVRDSGGLVYRFDPSRNLIDETLDKAGARFVLGVDLGYDDAFAYVLLGYSSDRVWEEKSFKRTHLIPTEWAEHIKEVQAQYKIERIVIDTGGLGKAVAQEFKKRHAIDLVPAMKKNKNDYISLINDDFVAGKILIKPNSRLYDEIFDLQWDEDREKEDPSFDNHCCDALLYAWREAYHWVKKGKSSKDEEKDRVLAEYLEKKERENDATGKGRANMVKTRRKNARIA